MSTVINGYELVTEMTTADAGMCRWAFAVKNGHEFFIKEFLSPKYPLDEGKLGPELTRSMRESADAFFEKRKKYYSALSNCRTGNIMVNLDFFRFGAKYYAVTDKVNGQGLSIERVADSSEDCKRVLIKSLLYSVSRIHAAGIVHADLKPENLLIKPTAGGFCTAKIIDFDAGFFEGEPIDNIEGSQNYFSPEAVLKTNGSDIDVTIKADVFALGLLIHQYWCGKMPEIPEKYHYVSEAVLNDETVILNNSIPEDIQNLIRQMLVKYADERISAEDAWKCMGGKDIVEDHSEETIEPVTIQTKPWSGTLLAPSLDDLD